MYSIDSSSNQDSSVRKPGIPSSKKEHLIIVSASLFLVAGLLGLIMADEIHSNQPVTVALEIFLGFVIIGFVFAYPAIGIGLTITSTAVIEMLPSVPLLTSVMPLIGMITLLACFVKRRQWETSTDRPLFTGVEWFGILFIVWIFGSHFSTILSSWFTTLLQLWVLAWLARRLMRTERDYLIVMTIFVGGVLLSAIIAIAQTRMGIFDLAHRAEGFAGGANTASRYFVYGIVLLSFLQSRQTANFLWRLLALVGVGILLVATFSTVSRSGILMLGLALVLLSRRLLVGKQRTLILWLILVLGIAWLFSDISGTVLDPIRVFDSISSGTDTVGLRYTLWKSGWSMWLDHPISGVGIGRYINFLPAYWSASSSLRNLTPHNTYIQILAETGLIGFILFGCLIVTALKNFWARAHAENPQYAMMNWIWFVVLVTLLVGGITKTDVADKLLWFMIGLSSNESWI